MGGGERQTDIHTDRQRQRVLAGINARGLKYEDLGNRTCSHTGMLA